MIKDFETYIKEGRMGRLVNADELGDRKQDEVTEDMVKSCSYSLNTNNKTCGKITIKKENGKTVVDIEGNYFINEEVTEIPFQLGTVTGNFYCISSNLTSLYGCPKKVGGNFSCASSPSIVSLEGCPEEVGGDFYCFNCGSFFTEKEVRSLCDVKGKVVVTSVI